MQFSPSKVEYVSHNLSNWYGKCPHGCIWCFNQIYRKRGWKWACGPLRKNEKALKIAKKANASNVTCLMLSFTNDPLPYGHETEIQRQRLAYLLEILEILEERQIPTKVLTKNRQIHLLTYKTIPYDYIQIGLSITTNPWNSTIERTYERCLYSNDDRIYALKALAKKGFRTWVSMEPILPETDIKDLLRVLR